MDSNCNFKNEKSVKTHEICINPMKIKAYTVGSVTALLPSSLTMSISKYTSSPPLRAITTYTRTHMKDERHNEWMETTKHHDESSCCLKQSQDTIGTKETHYSALHSSKHPITRQPYATCPTPPDHVHPLPKDFSVPCPTVRTCLSFTAHLTMFRFPGVFHSLMRWSALMCLMPSG